MAEILLSLTIIGVVAAITLPSLTGNINERTWNTQRKAFYARMSQAIALMPSLNGYGSTVDNVAETFITNGLSKVLKINNICDNTHLADCGLPAKINPLQGEKFDVPTRLSALNVGLTGFSAEGVSIYNITNTKAAAFETANGESVLTFYNPNCLGKDNLVYGPISSGYQGYYMKQNVCANFVFDLNGKKGPNTFGKDIGAITVLYPTDSSVVIVTSPKRISGNFEYNNATSSCRDLSEGEFRLPNLDELLSLYYNRVFLGSAWEGGILWSSNIIDNSTAWSFDYVAGVKYPAAKIWDRPVICVIR